MTSLHHCKGDADDAARWIESVFKTFRPAGRTTGSKVYTDLDKRAFVPLNRLHACTETLTDSTEMYTRQQRMASVAWSVKQVVRTDGSFNQPASPASERSAVDK